MALNPNPFLQKTAADEVGWKEFLSTWRWEQGEHVTLLGPTGAGKTTLGLAILPKREWVAVMATKRRDPIVKELSWPVVRRWPPPPEHRRYVLWPDVDKGEAHQQEQFFNALHRAWTSGGWTLYLDELRFIDQDLRLHPMLVRLWLQARSLGATLVAGAQRPYRVPQEALDQATHLFIWGFKDRRDLMRLGEISGGIDGREIQETVRDLARYEVLYINARDGHLVKTKVTR